MKRISFLLFSILSVLQCFAQVETRYYQEGDTAFLFRDYIFQNLKQNGIVIKMPSFDLDTMREADKEMEGLDVPYRFGKGFDVSYTLSDGLWQNVDGGRLWSLSFESEGAISLNFIFENMYLPVGASLFIVNNDKTVVYGPVTSEVLVPRESSFLTDIIPGSCSTIYLFEPLAKINESTLSIKRVIHGYRGFDFKQIDRSRGDASSCNIDVACYPEYDEESKGVALVLLSNGVEWCSGALLMSTNLSFAPYFLTAFHCIDYPYTNDVLSDSEIEAAENWMFKFCFKKTTCSGSSLATSYTYNKADFCSAWSDTDFALLRLKNSVSQNTNLTWLGWDRSNNTPSSGVGIHHPQGDVMKISIENNQFGTSCSHFGSNGWNVNYDDGILEYGSSGSPILNQNKLVVGQLGGGTTNNNPCYQTNGQYGKFYLSWTGGGTNSTRLSNWLDPVGTNQTTINSCHPMGDIVGESFICSYKDYYVDNLPPGYNVSWNLSNSYYNNGFNLIPSYPTTGHCRIVRNPNHDLENATLTAEIKYNGVTVKTLTKTGIYAYEGFRGHYVSGNISSDIDYTYILHVTPNYNTIITSHNFLGATVSYSSSGTTPLYWGFSPSSGEIDVTMPSNNNNIPIVLNIDDACGNQYTLYLFPTNYNSMSVSYGDNSITLTLNENGNPETGLSLDQPWTLGVSNALTGTLMATRSSMSSRSTTISTAGWPKGMYVVRVTIGNEVLTEKVIVK